MGVMGQRRANRRLSSSSPRLAVLRSITCGAYRVPSSLMDTVTQGALMEIVAECYDLTIAKSYYF